MQNEQTETVDLQRKRAGRVFAATVVGLLIASALGIYAGISVSQSRGSIMSTVIATRSASLAMTVSRSLRIAELKAKAFSLNGAPIEDHVDELGTMISVRSGMVASATSSIPERDATRISAVVGAMTPDHRGQWLPVPRSTPEDPWLAVNCHQVFQHELQVICALVSEVDLAQAIESGTYLLDSYQLKAPDGSVLHSKGVKQGSPISEHPLASARIGGFGLELTAYPGPNLIAAVGPDTGRTTALSIGALCLVALSALFARYRSQARQLDLLSAISNVRTSRDVLYRSTLSTTAEATGMLVWLIHPDERVETIGPWERVGGRVSDDATLASITRPLEDAEDIEASLRAAMKEARQWSRIIRARIDDEVRYFQSSCSPVLDARGDLVAMLGTSVEITDSLQNSSVIREFDAKIADQVRLAAEAVVAVQRRVLGSEARMRDEARDLLRLVRDSLYLVSLRSQHPRDGRQSCDLADALDKAAKIAIELGFAGAQLSEIDGPRPRNLICGISPRDAVDLFVQLLSLASSSSRAANRPSIRFDLIDDSKTVRITLAMLAGSLTGADLEGLGSPYDRHQETSGATLSLALINQLATLCGCRAAFAVSNSPLAELVVTIDCHRHADLEPL